MYTQCWNSKPDHSIKNQGYTLQAYNNEYIRWVNILLSYEAILDTSFSPIISFLGMGRIHGHYRLGRYYTSPILPIK